MRHLLLAAKSNNEDSEALTLAIEVVGIGNDDLLANQLIELLLGEVDGEARVCISTILKNYSSKSQKLLECTVS